MIKIISIIILTVVPSIVVSDEVSGSATIVDGDTLRIGSTTIRLYGMDAPETRQTCERAGNSWPCGEESSRKLSQLVGEKMVLCYEIDRDRYGRVVAICRVGDIELGAAMVMSGLALAYRQYGAEYVKHETAAKDAARGMWSGDFVAPWDWRRGVRETVVPTTRDDDCLIKGNINRQGERIYHALGRPSYTATVIDESSGERWFCSEKEAEEAGWRAPR